MFNYLLTLEYKWIGNPTVELVSGMPPVERKFKGSKHIIHTAKEWNRLEILGKVWEYITAPYLMGHNTLTGDTFTLNGDQKAIAGMYSDYDEIPTGNFSFNTGMLSIKAKVEPILAFTLSAEKSQRVWWRKHLNVAEDKLGFDTMEEATRMLCKIAGLPMHCEMMRVQNKLMRNGAFGATGLITGPAVGLSEELSKVFLTGLGRVPTHFVTTVNVDSYGQVVPKIKENKMYAVHQSTPKRKSRVLTSAALSMGLTSSSVVGAMTTPVAFDESNGDPRAHIGGPIAKIIGKQRGNPYNNRGRKKGRR